MGEGEICDGKFYKVHTIEIEIELVWKFVGDFQSNAVEIDHHRNNQMHK